MYAPCPLFGVFLLRLLQTFSERQHKGGCHVLATASAEVDHYRLRFSAECQLVMLGLALRMHGDNALHTYSEGQAAKIRVRINVGPIL